MIFYKLSRTQQLCEVSASRDYSHCVISEIPYKGKVAPNFYKQGTGCAGYYIFIVLRNYHWFLLRMIALSRSFASASRQGRILHQPPNQQIPVRRLVVVAQTGKSLTIISIITTNVRIAEPNK